MKLKTILSTVGGAVVRNVVPGGGLILDVVNAALPAASQLLPDATGRDVEAAIVTLPPTQRAELLSRDYDVQIEQIRQGNESVREAIRADASDPQTTRPYIAKHALHVVAFVIVMVTSLWAYAVAAGKPAMILAITGGWPFVLALLGPLVTLLWAYFGVLREEHKTNVNASNGLTSPAGLLGAVAGLLKK